MKMNLQEFRNDLAASIYGMTKTEALDKGVCISCRKPPTFSTEAGRREYPISGLCEPCFDAMFEEEE